MKNLQLMMNVCLGSNLTLDGVFGPITRDVLKMYQRIYGLTPDGVYGPMTRARLPQTRDWVYNKTGSWQGADCTWRNWE